ncbi:MAG: glycosyltransferase family 39 protein [Acidimicrobiales bacterium]
MSFSSIDRRYLAWVVVVVTMVASFALGYHDLASRPLSQDEAASLRFSLAPAYSGIMGDGGNMAFYYLLLRGVVHVFGTSLAAVRLPSVVAGVVTVPVVFLVGKRLRGDRAGVVAALLFAVSLPLVYWQQTARAYTLGTLLVAVSTLAFLAMLDSTGRLPAYAYFLSTLLACYTLLFAALVVVAQLLSLLAWRARPLPTRRLAVALGAIAAGCIPLLVTAGNAGTAQIAWIPRPGPGALRLTGLSLMSASAADGTSAATLVAPCSGTSRS